jgi:hypothetical protein
LVIFGLLARKPQVLKNIKFIHKIPNPVSIWNKN